MSKLLPDFEQVTINGNPFPISQKAEHTPTMLESTLNPQLGGPSIPTTDLSTNKGMIKLTFRVTQEVRDQLNIIKLNGANNVIIIGNQGYTGCLLKKIPEGQLHEEVSAEFETNPNLV